jgi:hypothetical protein
LPWTTGLDLQELDATSDCEESVRSEIWDELGAISGTGAGSRDGSGGDAGLGGRSQTFQAQFSSLQPSARAQAVTGGGQTVEKPVEWIQSLA